METICPVCVDRWGWETEGRNGFSQLLFSKHFFSCCYMPATRLLRDPWGVESVFYSEGAQR